eukprot:13985074-Alexandrium_andersonii.AAC.1
MFAPGFLWPTVAFAPRSYATARFGPSPPPAVGGALGFRASQHPFCPPRSQCPAVVTADKNERAD